MAIFIHLGFYLSWMGLGVWVGMMLGVGTTCTVNSLMSMGLLARPWEHLGMAAAFGLVGHYHDKYLPLLREWNRDREHQLGLDAERTEVPWETKNWLERPDETHVPPVPKE